MLAIRVESSPLKLIGQKTKIIDPIHDDDLIEFNPLVFIDFLEGILSLIH